MYLSSFVFATLGTSMVYATIALGVVIVYRTNKVLPFHVGALAMLAAYVMSDYWAVEADGYRGLIIGLAAVFALCIGTGVILHLLIDKFGERYGHFVGTVITIAASTFMLGLMSLVWRGDVRRLNVPGEVDLLGTSFPTGGVIVFVVGAAIVIAVLIAMRITSAGLQMQAVANNARLAELRRIPVQKVLLVAWIGSSLLAASGGIMMAMLSSVSLEGSAIGVSAIVAAVLGGLYSMPFAVFGAVLLALSENLVTQFANPRYSEIVPITILVLLLILRPSGLSGSAEHIDRV